MRYGAFNQLWATRHGSGRVLAWTDSTIFSNFSAFEPGKTELMLGMLEWLNRRSLLDNVWVRVPELAHGLEIYALWEKLGVAAPACTTNGAVWSGGYVGVWHMNESPADAAPQIRDSTEFGSHGTCYGSMTASDLAPGMVGGALETNFGPELTGSFGQLPSSEGEGKDKFVELATAAGFDGTAVYSGGL